MNGIAKNFKDFNLFDKACLLAMMLICSSIVFYRTVNSISIMLLLLIWLAEGNIILKLKRLLKEPFFIAACLLLILYFAGIAISYDKKEAFSFLVKNLSWPVIPGVLLSKQDSLGRWQVNLLFKCFIVSVSIYMTMETALSLLQYCNTHDYKVFFYHNLVSHLGFGNAIAAAFYCILSLVLLMYLPDKRKWKWLLIIIFFIWIVLLNSKMFLGVLTLIVALSLLKRHSVKIKMLTFCSLLVIAAGIIFTNNPVKSRFRDMTHFRWSYLSDSSFAPSMYFDGLSLRAIYIRFGLEIVKEHHAFIQGVGTGDADSLLKKKIISYNMYTGSGTASDEGYLQYGYHNQYLQKYVQMGLMGLGVLLFIILYLFRQGIACHSGLIVSLLLIFIFSFFTDTLLEHQYGLVAFLVFTSLAVIDGRHAIPIHEPLQKI